MIGNGDISNDIFLAGDGLRKHRGQQILGAHTLNLRRDFLAALEAQQRQRAAGRPAPAHSEKRRREDGLLEHFLHGGGLQVMEDVA